MSKYQGKRPRHLGEIKRVDEQPRVSDLPAAAAAHEAPKLLLSGPSSPLGLFLEGAEGSKVSLSVDDLFHAGGTKSADQLVLKVCDAHIETQPFHVGAREVGAETGPLETAPKVALLAGVTETREPHVKSLRAVVIEKAFDCLRTADRHNRNALRVEIPSAPHGECFNGALVADPFNEHDRPKVQ